MFIFIMFNVSLKKKMSFILMLLLCSTLRFASNVKGYIVLGIKAANCIKEDCVSFYTICKLTNFLIIITVITFFPDGIKDTTNNV